MAHNVDETMALADVYAEALLQAAARRGEEEVVAEEFADLVRLMDESAELTGLLASASVDEDARRGSLERVFRGRMNDLLLNLLQVMNNRGRCRLVRQVRRCVQLRMERRHAQQEVVVETAMPLHESTRSAIVRALGSRLGKEILVIEQVRPELIGGAIMWIDDLEIDASVASRLRAMRKRLSDRATEEIESGRGYAVGV